MMPTATSFFSRPPEQITAQIEDKFFSGLKVGNQTFKLTYAKRFEALDEALIRHLVQSRSAVDQVLDIGMSSGTTTFELCGALERAGYAPRITGTDLSLDAYIVPVLPGCRVLVDASGYPLQYELLGFAIRPWHRRLDFLSGMIFVRSVVNRICGQRARRSIHQPAAGKARKVALVSPRVTRCGAITALRDDILIYNPALTRRFSVIRAANILNRDYFDEASLRRALAHVRSYLAGPGSWLLIARTHRRGEHHATLFRLDDGHRLIVAERFGKGSEVEDIANDG